MEPNMEEEYVAEMQEAYLRNQSTHGKTVAQTDRLMNMGRQKGRSRKKRNRNIKTKCTAPSTRSGLPRQHTSVKFRKRVAKKNGKGPRFRNNSNTITHEHDQFRSKWGPSTTVNHYKHPTYRYPLSEAWAHSNVSTKSRNASTKRSIKQSKTDRSHSWYSKK
eukprot:233787_1